MIVPMKKISLLCLESQKTAALEQLSGLGIMHPEIQRSSESGEIADLTKRAADAERVRNMLSSAAGKSVSESGDAVTAEDIAEILSLFEQKTALNKENDSLERDREKLLPWGDFSEENIRDLREKGVFVYLCVTGASSFRKMRENGDSEKLPSGAAVRIISENSNFCCYALISMNPLDAEKLDIAHLPERSLGEVNSCIQTNHEAIAKIDGEMTDFAGKMTALNQYIADTREKLEFAQAKESMKEQRRGIVCLSGYVPAPEMEKFRKAALENGWAFLAEDPGPDDMVPTLIKKPRFLEIMDPLFDFIGVSPGYYENDVNVFFLIFFPIFFGMIIGDAGYGALFILCAVIGKIALKNKEAARLPLNLFILLSSCALVYGWLNGSWFGIDKSCLPSVMRGWGFLTDPADPAARDFAIYYHFITPDMTESQILAKMTDFNSKFVQYFCFVLAACHLVSARLFKFCIGIREDWRAAGHIGWALLLFANAVTAISLVVFPGTFPQWNMYPYYAGLFFVVVTTRPSDALNMPFSVIGSFTDVLSYIRLFAVGLAGAYISQKFNEMGGMLRDALSALPVLGWILMITVQVFGNVLNIALGFLSVLVHGIRLNTLEFSNHVEMQWGGFRFHPLSRQQKTTKQTI